VPNVVGLTQAAATTAITNARLTVGTITFADSATAPAGSVISQTPVGGVLTSPGGAVALVISNGASAALGATVVTHNTTPALTVTSPSITPAENTLIVAVVSATAAANAALVPNVVLLRNSGLPSQQLTWTRATRSNVQPGTTSEVWWAFTPTARAAMTVSAALAGSVTSSIAVMTFTGAAPSLDGAASAFMSASSGAPSATLVTTRNSSLVIGIGTDLAAPRVMTPDADQTVIYQANPIGGTYWVQRSGTIGLAGTTVTVGDTYGLPTPDPWNLTLIEIRKP
jgi:hypothetical protein